MKRLGLRAAIGIGIIITTGLLTVAQGHAGDKKRRPTCDAATLEGLYILRPAALTSPPQARRSRRPSSNLSASTVMVYSPSPA